MNGLTINHPTPADFLSGEAPFGSIDSPSSIDKYAVVLREGARHVHLQQALCVVEANAISSAGEHIRQRQLCQIRRLGESNQHHETPLFRAQIRAHGRIPGLSGRADHVTADVYPVDAVQLNPNGAVRAKVSPLSALPPTGSEVILADNAAVESFVAKDAPGLLRVGYLGSGQTHMPLSLPHAGDDKDGAGEALHVGVFGKSGGGKTVFVGQLSTGWARHEEMGQLILDHDGDLSSMAIGKRADGSPHFSLTRAYAAVGRDPARVVRISHDQLRIEAPRDLAKVLRHEGFLQTLGVGSGEKANACEEKLRLLLHELLAMQEFVRLDYEETVAQICFACAETYALGPNGKGREKKEQEFAQTALTDGPTRRSLERIWERVQGYASRPHRVRDLVERALFEGEIVMIRLATAGADVDDMILVRVVKTMLDIARLSYLLRMGEGDGQELYGRFGYLRDRFRHYREHEVNAVAIIDEAHKIAGSYDAGSAGSVAHDLGLAVRDTRKYKLGFCFATQQISSIAKPIFDGMHTYVFSWGLRSSSELERVKEILTEKSALDLYLGMPEPKSSRIYSYSIRGAALPLANGAALSIRAYADQETFLAANELADPGALDTPAPTSPTLVTSVNGLATFDE